VTEAPSAQIRHSVQCGGRLTELVISAASAALHLEAESQKSEARSRVNSQKPEAGSQ
jgi:hypothetical protein